MITIENYPQYYKYIPIELRIFFSQTNDGENGKKTARTVQEFCNYYQKKYNTEELPQPRIVSILCDKLVSINQLSSFNKGGFDNMDNSYLGLFSINNNDPIILETLNNVISCEIYGFKFIYDYYKQYVLPILHTDSSGDVSIGSSFLYRGGILTAKHCIEGAKKIAIQNIHEEDLKNAIFYTLNKESMDLIFIKFETDIQDSIYLDAEAEVMDEVIAMGYPQVPGFHKFLTAEKALVSSRFTSTRGAVTSIAEDIWIRENLVLITAKIRGGNSGGPIINSKGRVIGVAANLATGEGKYDDLGYGTVIPIKFGNSIIEQQSNILDTSHIEFNQFIE